MNINNKHVVIAGGNSGIGFAVAQQAVSQGAKVTLIGRSEEKLTNAVKRLDGQASLVVMDLGDEQAAKTGFEKIGSYDYFVLSAADLTYSPLADMEREAIERMLATKFWGPVHLAKYGLKNLASDGAIVLFSGLAADRPAVGTSMVSALNAGVEGLTRALAIELAPVRVNAISPGVVRTEGWHFMSEADREGFFASLDTSLPVRHTGKPEELAHAVLFALTNTYMTGEVIHVNGGGSLS